MKKKHRRIVVDDVTFAWAGDWSHIGGRRVVSLRAWHQTDDERPVGPVLSVKLVNRHGGMVDCAAAVPQDARAAILLGRALGWSPEGRGVFWILPTHGLVLQDLDVVDPTMLG
ncbi:hypothetical protein FJV41_02790 [Myxococcus llanfairpwllgwyngyllgogerychwyrndrobwllllantysiliogogogochensis]|uniref:Uncharacterized protein n=1 Tax=Myxococcus llanfairpwllgwyngyllgogerychwyrndrobwllllantysiliogogogochensis TaxID=2590453 RepID=A0A540X8C5_9BACT|nr:hypothetical protein [Myxococcus llanfairpwllgwyngyllgogerychwyrndrobwllllantysiliogogogochensis]TQF17551.1 hypothetical protein FJV41_02790 [Myxococcus llanfairpwllgwyngyllgogerychwyrndrobwllllantysiliogogogochensis]